MSIGRRGLYHYNQAGVVGDTLCVEGGVEMCVKGGILYVDNHIEVHVH